MRSYQRVFAILWLLSATACSGQPSAPSEITLHFLGSSEIPFNKQFMGTTVGGLSGIDYDADSDTYFLISDDRSAINPARFYSAKILVTTSGLDSVHLTEVHSMLQSTGIPYPNAKQNPEQTPDPESIRFNPLTEQLLWTSEGERTIKASASILTNPTIILMDKNGKYLNGFSIPPNLSMQKTESGPRQNGTLEGLTFADQYKKLYASLEEPLYEDGPRADLVENNAWVRIYEYDVATRKNIAQYAYKLEPVAYPPFPENSFMVNGIPDILSLGNNKLLVIERSFSTGRLPCTVKVYVADLTHADNIISVASLAKTPPIHPISKKLLLNMDDLGVYIDNIEGVTFGPNLPNGHRTLLFVSDNNFNVFEKTQFLLFEVIPITK